MFTATDIRNVQFNKNMSGYKPAEVDVFIDRCADTVDTLVAENADLNKKLAILADKLQEYRKDEDSIRSALLSAQRLGDSVVRDSNEKAAQIIASANSQADDILANAKKEIVHYEAELERLKKEIADFKASVLSLYKEHLSMIKSIPDNHVADEVVAKPEAEPQKSISEKPLEAVAPAEKSVQEIPAARVSEAVKTEAPKSKFANLKFGEDYDIGQDQDD